MLALSSLAVERENKQEFLPGRENNSCFKDQNINTFATFKWGKGFSLCRIQHTKYDKK